MNFNPRSHERSDTKPSETLIFSLISIHAPTRGATSLAVNGHANAGISIHAPTRGATNSLGFDFENFGISIHAPTRGATKPSVNCIEGRKDFNPRSHERSDGIVSFFTGILDDFNPRSHERSDGRYA